MFKKIDAYIIKRYLMTFIVMLLLFIPIGIMVDVAEKIDKFKENEVPFFSSAKKYFPANAVTKTKLGCSSLLKE